MSGASQTGTLADLQPFRTHNFYCIRVTRYFSRWMRNFKSRHRTVLISGCVAGEERGADWCAVQAEFRSDDLSCFKAWLKRAPFYFLNALIEDERAGVHHTAAEHDTRDIQQVDHTRHARADVFASALDHHERKVVAFICLVGY